MKFEIKQPTYNKDGKIILKEIDIQDIAVTQYALMAIDGSTTNTGIAITRESDGALMYIICLLI